MVNNGTYINEESIYSWICSTGYLLPSNELELARFEKLHPPGSIKMNPAAIDPFAIVNGTREKKNLSIRAAVVSLDRAQELRMAARKHDTLPSDILDRIKKNQEKGKDDQHDSTPGEKGNN